MSDARWNDPREYDGRDPDHQWPRVYDPRDRDDHDPRDALMRDVDLPRGDERELVVDRDRVYELDGEDSLALAAVMETMIASVRISPQQVGQRAEITTTTIRMRSHVEMNMHGTRGLTHDLTHPSSVAAGNQIGAGQLNLKQPSRTDATATGATLARDVPGAPGR